MFKKKMLEIAMAQGLRNFVDYFDEDRPIGSISDKEIKIYVKSLSKEMEKLDNVI